MTTPTVARGSHSSGSSPSVPSKHCRHTSTRSERSRNRIGCVSGSPKRQLNSMTRGCPAVVDHEAGVEKAAIVDAVGGEAAHGRQHDLAHDALVDGVGDDGRRRIGAHAARVRAAVAVVARLVVLRARERHDARAVDDCDEARFLAGEKVFDHDGCAGLRRTAVCRSTPVERLLGLGQRWRDDHAFAGGEAVGLDDDRRRARARRSRARPQSR